MTHGREKLIEMYFEWRIATFPEWARGRGIPKSGVTTQDPATRFQRAQEGRELLKQLKEIERKGKVDDTDIDVRLCIDDCQSAFNSLEKETLTIREVIDALAPNPDEEPWLENERLLAASAAFPRALARAQASGPWLKEALLAIAEDLKELEKSRDSTRQEAGRRARIECEHLANAVGYRPLHNKPDPNEPATKMWSKAQALVRRDRQRLENALSNIMPNLLPENAFSRLNEELSDRGRALGSMELWAKTLKESIEKTGWVTIPSHAETSFSISLPGRSFSGAHMHTDDPMKSSTVSLALPFSPLTLPMTMAHETYPGHLLQRVYQSKCESMPMKLLGNATSNEGWAHYAEMKINELGVAEPRDLEVGLAQRSLLRSTRLLVRAGVVSKKIDLNAAQSIFRETAMLDHKTAKREAERAQWDPKVASYALGREALEQMEREFVDRGMGDAPTFRSRALPIMCAPLDMVAKRLGLKKPENI